jgi:hypothetical protein
MKKTKKRMAQIRELKGGQEFHFPGNCDEVYIILAIPVVDYRRLPPEPHDNMDSVKLFSCFAIRKRDGMPMEVSEGFAPETPVIPIAQATP